ncbi:efflux RND transporter periplasmic adaptor subunit [filamentous cyanobacterium LEGE 11480]|uniref:Efflux RND transporter periplasmic adaptor subunit n=2 Tax=Romeriopsis TaxID=2992131 RepID=A0A928VND4_9CYAN|nr:efflux RND transporter periplasmic adaptor subunit [Romeriopsis navalis LEGE 11480]
MGAIVLFTGVGLILRANSGTSSNEQAETTAAKPARLPIRAEPVALEPIQGWTYGDGFVSAVVKKHLNFQAEGTVIYLKRINGRILREGDFVRQGALLARVDPRKYDADITVAAAGRLEASNRVLDATANLRQAEEALAQAQADLQKAKTDETFSRDDLKRYQDLSSAGGIARREAELKATEYKNSQANVTAALAKVRSAQSQISAAKTQVTTAEAGVNSATAKLAQSNISREDTELVAPFNGVISRLNIREGDYWTPQIVNASADYQKITERLPIIMINPSQLEVDVELPAFEGAQARSGQRAFIILERNSAKAKSGKLTGENLMQLASAQGTISSVSPSVSPGARSVRVTLRITQGADNLKDGARVAAWIATQEKPKAIVAPFKAFVFRDQQPYVFVLNESQGIVEQRAVQPGIEGLSKREILAGVQPNEKLVTEGINRLVNGTPVEVMP